MKMKRIDPKDLIEALAGPWAAQSRCEVRLKSYHKLPAELRANAERHAAFGAGIFLRNDTKAS
jgi:hypothetical protein